MSIYTKRGDGGKTSTFAGPMSKSDALAEVLGSIDELNSWIGLIRFNNRILKNMQRNLMDITSCLAGSKKKLRVGETRKLEKLIDKLTGELPPLKNFIYPVGEIQIARAVCRRAEREIVRISNSKFLISNDQKNILKYMNRLSDALFVMARWVNHQNKIREEVWK
jgi:cob(I)alamin adenosyltransferase